jgi:Tol biopolymer transport system component
MRIETGVNGARKTAARTALVLAVGTVIGTAAVTAKEYTEWSPGVSAETGSDPSLNTTFNDGCPILSPDGLTLYMATNRQPGGLGGQDIWVARRDSTLSGWGAPQPLPSGINSASDDFCPTPVRGKGLYFVSKRTEANGDIYFAKQNPDGSWDAPERLGPNINSPLEEWSPSYFEDEEGRPVLYFSRNTPGTNNHDIYQSIDFGPAEPAAGGINGPLSDARPNVRKDGLEIVFDSNRQANGNQDVWTARRESTSAPWGQPRHLTQVSSPVANDTRASLSWDGSILLVGSARPADANGRPGEGMADIYVSVRSMVPGGED